MPIKMIYLDADDTLWHNERHFRRAQEGLADILDDSRLKATLERIE